MKRIVKYLFLKMFRRSDIFHMIYSRHERTAIENALWRRSEDDTDKGSPVERQNEHIKYLCKELAKELYT